jgi:hypothetical protein
VSLPPASSLAIQASRAPLGEPLRTRKFDTEVDSRRQSHLIPKTHISLLGKLANRGRQNGAPHAGTVQDGNDVVAVTAFMNWLAIRKALA